MEDTEDKERMFHEWCLLVKVLDALEEHGKEVTHWRWGENKAEWWRAYGEANLVIRRMMHERTLEMEESK